MKIFRNFSESPKFRGIASPLTTTRYEQVLLTFVSKYVYAIGINRSAFVEDLDYFVHPGSLSGFLPIDYRKYQRFGREKPLCS